MKEFFCPKCISAAAAVMFPRSNEFYLSLAFPSNLNVKFGQNFFYHEINVMLKMTDDYGSLRDTVVRAATNRAIDREFKIDRKCHWKSLGKGSQLKQSKVERKVELNKPRPTLRKKRRKIMKNEL